MIEEKPLERGEGFHYHWTIDPWSKLIDYETAFSNYPKMYKFLTALQICVAILFTVFLFVWILIKLESILFRHLSLIEVEPSSINLKVFDFMVRRPVDRWDVFLRKWEIPFRRQWGLRLLSYAGSVLNFLIQRAHHLWKKHSRITKYFTSFHAWIDEFWTRVPTLFRFRNLSHGPLIQVLNLLDFVSVFWALAGVLDSKLILIFLKLVWAWVWV